MPTFKPPISLPDAMSNIRACLRHSTRAEREGARVWYSDARDLVHSLAGASGKAPAAVAAAMATLSPSVLWSDNIEFTVKLLATGEIPSYNGYPRQLQRAKDILASGRVPPDVRGLKCSAFYRLIVSGGNDADVCVDTHAGNVAILGYETVWPWKEPVVNLSRYLHYEWVSSAYRAVAWAKGQRPCDVQAQAWLTYRRLKQAWGRVRVAKNRV